MLFWRDQVTRNFMGKGNAVNFNARRDRHLRTALNAPFGDSCGKRARHFLMSGHTDLLEKFSQSHDNCE